MFEAAGSSDEIQPLIFLLFYYFLLETSFSSVYLQQVTERFIQQADRFSSYILLSFLYVGRREWGEK